MKNNFPYVEMSSCSFDSDTFFDFCGFVNMYLSEYRLYVDRLTPLEIHEFVYRCNLFIQYLSLVISRCELKYPGVCAYSPSED